MENEWINRFFGMDFRELTEKEFGLLYKWGYKFPELKIESVQRYEQEDEILYHITYYPNRSAFDLMNLIKGRTAIDP